MTGKKQHHPCCGCAHFYGAYRGNKCCNYLFDTGKLRPCPPGAACTVRISPERWAKKRGYKSFL